ncbi:MAG: 2-amino-4-hydroxy-6-hydroxymethyldihydropteridine diphosphokinase [Halomonas sp.]|nr:2-amino-4-hydroxy-6-hydroxymethyldihydropteridine diphosphokinase [Halomonas sp.]MDN6296685.1 2-amino-4-hydroxy-6-hydroxymethyldihydropteridine diphosphokinase [Halomonas sp.]MDN6314126.1 2-amino-4-hydroxy-6-hydroxymethyldihydropteridine diphosphokinase [Halomonas sp.]MDN6335191.1 2-amino-4-hydroxy-6-hydroxymethyldihydropteridine diphosphokinase [Halomonas sp.]
MCLIILGLGSNLDALENFHRCLDALHERFGELQVSRVFESEPVGVVPDSEAQENFHNMVVAFNSNASAAALNAWSKRQEKSQGRLPKSAGASRHPIDIDLLAVGELCGEFASESGVMTLPSAEITVNAFVLRPLAELLPDARHPQTGDTYAELWQRAHTGHNMADQRLWPVAFSWCHA